MTTSIGRAFSLSRIPCALSFALGSSRTLFESKVDPVSQSTWSSEKAPFGETHLHTVSSPGSIFLLNTVSQSINSNPHGKRSFGPDHHGSGTMRHNRPNRTTIARATNFLSHTTRHCGRNSVSQSHNVQIIIITPGQCAMADQIDSPLPGRVTQQKINLPPMLQMRHHPC